MQSIKLKYCVIASHELGTMIGLKKTKISLYLLSNTTSSRHRHIGLESIRLPPNEKREPKPTNRNRCEYFANFFYYYYYYNVQPIAIIYKQKINFLFESQDPCLTNSLRCIYQKTFPYYVSRLLEEKLF